MTSGLASPYGTVSGVERPATSLDIEELDAAVDERLNE